MKLSVKQRNFYAKAVTRIAPKVEKSKKAYKRNDKHKNKEVYYSLLNLNLICEV